MFLAHVVQAEAGQGAPLAYFRGKFGKLELAQDAQTYDEVRRLVLTRALGPDVAVEVEGLARQLTRYDGDAVKAFAAYQAERIPRTALVQRSARTWGQWARQRNCFLVVHCCRTSWDSPCSRSFCKSTFATRRT